MRHARDGGDPKTERIQLVISAAELQQLDRWRFANGYGSRSEAIRRLMKLGLDSAGTADRPRSATESEPKA